MNLKHVFVLNNDKFGFNIIEHFLSFMPMICNVQSLILDKKVLALFLSPWCTGKT